ncbi:MAG: Ribosomal RNA large subunit methyltransferase K [Spirochaetes bacterium ADurb.Bin215]|jgi:23S rRNA (cytosine1962-C5)-methyltransferase|nr:MAG: Ribosomal RNA large subunit methyltransferase K [Spirochaetes bacterium ADurb.Bin215]
MNNQSTENQALMFANRLSKRYAHLKKWAKRTTVSSFRLYDKDIPEVPLAVDLYTDAETSDRHLHVSLYERPYDKPDDEENAWMAVMKETAAKTLSVPENHVHTKIRRRQRGTEAQYDKVSERGTCIIIDEGGAKFRINLSDYLDTGIFLDHRPARLHVRETAAGKRVLNLFCYTGAFSVHAALGGAASVTSIDLSRTYLGWAADNMTLNGFGSRTSTGDEKNPPASGAPFIFYRYDAMSYLKNAVRARDRWDLIICDPPTFSNSKKLDDVFDINRDWTELCRLCLAVLAPGGTLLFSTNSRKLKFDSDLIGGAAANPATRITDLSDWSIPEDFRNRKIHRLWKFELP